MELKTKILKIIDRTHNVKSFIFEKKKLDFISGQYCMISFPDEIDAKPFTYSSSPTEERIEITIKKNLNFTSRLFECKVGDELVLKGPMGKELNFEENISDDIIFLAGGSGITPFISALRYARDKKMKNRFMLFFGNKTKKDILYENELKEISEKIDLNVINVLSEEKGEESQFISKDLIEKHQKIDTQIIYICGPPIMTKKLKEELSDFNLRIEPWEI